MAPEEPQRSRGHPVTASFPPAAEAEALFLGLPQATGLPRKMRNVELAAAQWARLGFGGQEQVVINLTKALEKSLAGM